MACGGAQIFRSQYQASVCITQIVQAAVNVSMACGCSIPDTLGTLTQGVEVFAAGLFDFNHFCIKKLVCVRACHAWNFGSSLVLWKCAGGFGGAMDWDRGYGCGCGIGLNELLGLLGLRLEWLLSKALNYASVKAVVSVLPFCNIHCYPL